MIKLSRFFLNEVPDAEGRYLDAMLNEDYNWMEETHDYIQWWFPNATPSAYNAKAPLLTELDVQEINASIDCRLAFMECVNKMLGFFGLKMIGGYVLKTELFEQRRYTLFEEFNHNHLRFSRMLLAMYYFGFSKAAKKICDFVSDEAIETSSIGFWNQAVEGKMN